MSDPEALIDQLRQFNRRWKALALAACSALVLAAFVVSVVTARERMRAERALRAKHAALVQFQG